MPVKAATKKKTVSRKLDEPRVREVPQHRSFRLSKRKLKQHEPIPGAYQLIKQSFSLVKGNKRLIFGFVLLNAVLSFVFVQGFGSAFNINEVKDQVQQALNGTGGRLGTSVILFSYLTQNASSATSATTGVYQAIMVIITSLATIWALRQVLAKERPTVKESFYRGMYPLIPFVLVLFVIALQFVPMLLGTLLYGAANAGGLTTTGLEKALWLLLSSLFLVLTLYLVLSSVFALYIVTLPDMKPLAALRSAQEMVLHRRLVIFARIIIFVLALSLLTAVIFIPLLLFLTPVAEILFVVMTSFSLIFLHVYMYLLYRSLI